MAKRKDKPEGMAEISAMREAQRRWGKYATVRFRRCEASEPRNGKPQACSAFHAKDCPGGFPYFQVGKVENIAGVFAANMIKGYGATFDECFVAADYSDHETYKSCCVESGHPDGCEMRRALKAKYMELRAADPATVAAKARAATPTAGA